MNTSNFKLPFRVKKKYFLCGVLSVFLLDYFGLFLRLFEKDFTTEFVYPYEGNISFFVLQLQLGLTPDRDPINTYNYNYIHSNPKKCDDSNIRLIYIIKSSLDNFDRRDVIRKTWGFEKRFSDVSIRRIFILGNTENMKLTELIKEEIMKYNDIVQMDFKDNYYNNTIKTMSAIKWLVEFCPHSRFYFFSDDDMYISTKNVLRFLRNPANYPDYLSVLNRHNSTKNSKNKQTNLIENAKAKLRYVYNYELPEDVILYAGYVFNSSPHRHKSSKWYVSLKDYPYNLWPPYVTAGSYVLSQKALIKIYYTSMYTKHFKFDDIYLGLVALKAGIKPFHCDYFYFYKKKYSPLNYKYVIASHGYGDVIELQRLWNEQKELGNA